MRGLRSVRIKVTVCWFALIALIGQSFLLSQFTAAHAAKQLGFGLVLAELADLGLEPADVPCQTSVANQTSDPGQDTQTGPHSHCAVCQLSSIAAFAIFDPNVDLVDWPRATARTGLEAWAFVAGASDRRPPVRGPPLTVATA